jgi:hypothetical protein
MDIKEIKALGDQAEWAANAAYEAGLRTSGAPAKALKDAGVALADAALHIDYCAEVVAKMRKRLRAARG